MSNKIPNCQGCNKQSLTKDEVGACKKILGNEISDFYCLNCLAEYLECDIEELKEKIEEFKAEGCKLFS